MIIEYYNDLTLSCADFFPYSRYPEPSEGDIYSHPKL